MLGYSIKPMGWLDEWVVEGLRNTVLSSKYEGLK